MMTTFDFFPPMKQIKSQTFRRSGWALLCLALIGVFPPASAQDSPTSPALPLNYSRSELLDKVTAVAGPDLITLRDIEEDLRLSYLELGAGQPARFPRPFFEKRRDELIERQLLYRYSEEELRRDIPEGQPTLTPEMQTEIQTRVAQTIGVMRSHFEDEAAFRAELTQYGLNVDTLYQKLLKHEEQNLVVSMALGRQIQLPADEVNAYKQELQAAGKSLYRYRLQHILITFPPNASPHEQNRAHSRALDIGLRVRGRSLTFEDAAREYSQAPGGREGGDLGYVESRDLAEPIRQALAYTRPGEITMPLELGDGYHLFKVLEIEDARDFLWQQKFRERRKAVMEKLLKTRRVEKLEF